MRGGINVISGIRAEKRVPFALDFTVTNARHPHAIDRFDQVVIIARRVEEVIGCGVRDEMTGSEWSQIGGLENP
jgi:hypothetical protein